MRQRVLTILRMQKYFTNCFIATWFKKKQIYFPNSIKTNTFATPKQLSI